MKRKPSNKDGKSQKCGGGEKGIRRVSWFGDPAVLVLGWCGWSRVWGEESGVGAELGFETE